MKNTKFSVAISSFLRCISSFFSDTEEISQEESPVLTKREVGTYADKSRSVGMESIFKGAFILFIGISCRLFRPLKKAPQPL
ncbi:hypothetical protein ACK1LH_19150 [Metabacillus indicus]|uniref:hypothetical protein n=1 Tax=Metabacillus indicus TaxID=246786 RepID=UPI003983F299